MSSAAPTDSKTTFLDIAGKKTQITRGGSGSPLLYLHSAGGETEWIDFHDGLAAQHSVIAPAHPGFALSEGLQAIDDIQDLAWHYVDLLDALELDRVPIVGFSLGAWIAMELAVLRPDRVGPLVLVAAAGIRVPEAPPAELFIDDFDKIRKLLFFDPEGPVVDAAIPTSLDDPRILNWLRAREATARVAWNPYLHNPRLPQHLRRITSRTLIIWGEHDRLLPLAQGRFLEEHLPNARLSVLPECGHMVPYEQRDAFVDQTLAFLQS